MTSVQGTEYDFSQGRDSTINNFILFRDPNDFNNFSIATMIFVVRYSDNFNNLTVNFCARTRAQRCGDECAGRRGLLCQLLHSHPWPTLVIRMDMMMMTVLGIARTVMTVLALAMTVMTFG